VRRILIAGILVSALAAGSFGQRAQTPPPDEESATALKAATSLKARAKARPNVAAPTPKSSSYADWDVWRNITIGAGQSVNLDSDIYYANADTARVSIRSRNNDLPSIVVSAYWAVPEAEFYNVTDIVNGGTFPYRNVGGATFSTYGSQLRLRLTNNGTSTMSLAQVIVFARGL
jgi:hypothetical protein